MKRNATNAAAKQIIEEMQQEVKLICEPRYHEFYKDEKRYGYSKITIPKKRI